MLSLQLTVCADVGMQQGKEAVGYVHLESGRPETTDEASYKEAGQAIRAPRRSALHRSTQTP